MIFQWENEIQEQGIVTFSPIHQTGENLINLLFLVQVGKVRWMGATSFNTLKTKYAEVLLGGHPVEAFKCMQPKLDLGICN